MSPANDKLCMVCGGKALGYNFNAVTCESCKAFFRRNALSSKDFTCPFEENCKISVVTRRFCQKCRLDKCFTIGMRKDYIMSEEDKILKKMKIEQNRTKRKTTANTATKEDKQFLPKAPLKKFKTECLSDDNNGEDEVSQSDMKLSMQNNETKIHLSAGSENNENMFPLISSSTELENRPIRTPLPSLQSSSAEIVDCLVNYPEDASKLINHLMKTPNDAVEVMTKILNSQKDAMRFIGHLIGAPGDALKIISKIMNSPFDALTVFTKFMSSPTDALEIIAKIASSPNEVLQFIQQLMNSPEDALQIMNKFMNSPAEALKLLNKMVNNPSIDSTTTATTEARAHKNDETLMDLQSNPMIKKMLGNKFENQPPQLSNKTCANDVNNHTAYPKTGETSTSSIIKHILNEVQEEPIQNDTLEAAMCDAIYIEYQTFTLAGNSPNASRDLTEAERSKLNELIVANKALYDPIDGDLTGLDECNIQVWEISNQPLKKCKYFYFF